MTSALERALPSSIIPTGRTALITEPIYTGKTLFALYRHIEQGLYEKGSQIMMLHTGGLQGLRGYIGRGLDELIKQCSVCSVSSNGI